ncbi:putative Zn(II)2Cys6 transcription factor [Xylariaceae sp. FL0255]|nr:putative Zn(II)2Cys6 transcription factor [Xylariaceae sp. FL0255]
MADERRQSQSGMACDECRRKRVRCDRRTPQCTTCLNSGKVCVVRESISRRGPKKGYLKTLQKTIEDLQCKLSEQQAAPNTETRLCSPFNEDTDSDINNSSSVDDGECHSISNTTPAALGDLQLWTQPLDSQFSVLQPEPWDCIKTSLLSPEIPVLNHTEDLLHFTGGFGFQITPMIHNDLDQLFFDRAYIFAPIVQVHRYRRWSKLPNKTKQQTCLQFAMWTLAASLSIQFHVSVRQLYGETIQLLHEIELEEPCHQISIEQAQARLFLAMYELTCEDFQRGLMSAGMAFRLVQMMRLYELDVPQSPSTLDKEQIPVPSSPSLQVSNDWVDIETKRRTFWLAYTIDRFTSLVDGLHSSFDDRMASLSFTLLPAPEANFASGRAIETRRLTQMPGNHYIESLEDAMSPFTETIIAAHMCGRVLEHKRKNITRARDTTIEFCRRHRGLNAILAQRIRTLRTHASVEQLDPVLTFSALAAYTSILMLYDSINSKSFVSDAQASQLTKAFQAEHQQQTLDAVAGISHLLISLDQHFQTYPLTPIFLLLCAKFSKSHPELDDASNVLMPHIKCTLQIALGANRLSHDILRLIEPQSDTPSDLMQLEVGGRIC